MTSVEVVRLHVPSTQSSYGVFEVQGPLPLTPKRAWQVITDNDVTSSPPEKYKMKITAPNRSPRIELTHKTSDRERTVSDIRDIHSSLTIFAAKATLRAESKKLLEDLKTDWKQEREGLQADWEKEREGLKADWEKKQAEKTAKEEELIAGWEKEREGLRADWEKKQAEKTAEEELIAGWETCSRMAQGE